MTLSPESQNPISAAFSRISDECAVNYLQRYFGLNEWAGSEYTGAHFERFGERRVDEMLAEDVVAVSFLSLHVPAKASIGILGEYAEHINCYLRGISSDLAMEDLKLEDHDEYFGKTSAAQQLWGLLRADGRARWGVGPTTASKLMARKRPSLIPIYDSVVAKVVSLPKSTNTWRVWHEAFAQDHAFVQRLRALRSETGLHDIALLRILDVVLWMQGTDGGDVEEAVDSGGDF